MLSGAFQATLHRVLTCAMLSQEYQGKIAQDFFYVMLSGASQTALHIHINILYIYILYIYIHIHFSENAKIN